MSAYPNLAKRHKIAYVGTYPPKECGIATFTLDIVNSTDLSGWRSIVFAVDDAVPDGAASGQQSRLYDRKRKQSGLCASRSTAGKAQSKSAFYSA